MGLEPEAEYWLERDRLTGRKIPKLEEVKNIKDIPWEIRPEGYWDPPRNSEEAPVGYDIGCEADVLSRGYASKEEAQAWLAQPNPGPIKKGYGGRFDDAFYIVRNRVFAGFKAASDYWWSLWLLA